MHHDDAPGLDPRADITDLFAFQSPLDPARSVLILNVHPEARPSAGPFHPQVSYELKIDTNADFEAEIAYHVQFLSQESREQLARVYHAAGPQAREAGPVGEVIIQNAPVSPDGETLITVEGGYLFYAGLRSDPFFADRLGFQNQMQWTGQDYFADKNVLGIALELPNSALGPNRHVGIWARTMLLENGRLIPANQVGRPGNNIYRGGAALNTTPQSEQRSLYLSQYVETFRSYGYEEKRAEELALEWLPDILPYNFTSAAGFPNGRRLTDDIVDHLLLTFSGGKIAAGDLVGPHTDFLPGFPYLGPPHLETGI